MKKIVLYTLLTLITVTNINANTVEYGTESIGLTDGYKKVGSAELPPAVVEQILKEYPTSKLGGVYKNDKNQFKLIMVLQSGTRRTVYIDQYGRWFKPKRKR